MPVETRASSEHRHVVAFAARLRGTLADLPAGATLRLGMEPLHGRGDCWRVTAVGPTGRGDPHTEPVDTGRRPVDPDSPRA
jgi:hypothetical protein